jgi:hypothetical protein
LLLYSISVYAAFLSRDQFHEDAPGLLRVTTKFFPHPGVSRRRRISFVEDQVDHRECGLKPAAQLVSMEDLEWNIGFGESSLGAKDSLAKGFLRYKEGPSNFGGREAAN